MERRVKGINTRHLPSYLECILIGKGGEYWRYRGKSPTQMWGSGLESFLKEVASTLRPLDSAVIQVKGRGHGEQSKWRKTCKQACKGICLF